MLTFLSRIQEQSSAQFFARPARPAKQHIMFNIIYYELCGRSYYLSHIDKLVQLVFVSN